MFKKVWHDPVWSKVIAAGILSALGLVWAGAHFEWWPLVFSTSPVPHWLLGLLILIAASAFLLVTVMIRRPGLSAATVSNLPIPKLSPALIVKDAGKNLIITNDGLNAAVNVELGPLVHEEEHEIAVLKAPFGSIPSQATEQRRINVAQRAPTTFAGLWDAMRSGCMLPQPTDSVTVRFDDTNGNKFAQRFELTSEVDGSVTWKPGPVTFR